MTKMTLEVVFNNQIHRLSGIPNDYYVLIGKIANIFEQLPQRWILKYTNSNGHRIILSEKNYINVLRLAEAEAERSQSSIRVHITPLLPNYKYLSEEAHHCQQEEFQRIKKQEVMHEEFPHEEIGICEKVFEESIAQVSKSNKTQDISLILEEDEMREEQLNKGLISYEEKKMLEKIARNLARTDLYEEKRKELQEQHKSLFEKLALTQKEQFEVIKERFWKNYADEVSQKDNLNGSVANVLSEQLPSIDSLLNRVLNKNKKADTQINNQSQQPFFNLRNLIPIFGEGQSRQEHATSSISFLDPSLMKHIMNLFSREEIDQMIENLLTYLLNSHGNDTISFILSFVNNNLFQIAVRNTLKKYKVHGEMDRMKLKKLAKQMYKDLSPEKQKIAHKIYGDLPEGCQKLLNSLLMGLPEKIYRRQTPKNSRSEREEALIESEEEEEPAPRKLLKSQYYEEFEKKVQYLKELFPDMRTEDLLEIIAKTPSATPNDLASMLL